MSATVMALGMGGRGRSMREWGSVAASIVAVAVGDAVGGRTGGGGGCGCG